uniref:Uncharacterized protein n=1 Tax=Anguilla anguilla TaxID=7936 RepID=A0A0E9XTL5_ANGAN
MATLRLSPPFNRAESPTRKIIILNTIKTDTAALVARSLP